MLVLYFRMDHAMDCHHYQHSLGRDAGGAESVNLSPPDAPKDVPKMFTCE